MLQHWLWLRIAPFTRLIDYWLTAGVTGQQGPRHLIPSLVYQSQLLMDFRQSSENIVRFSSSAGKPREVAIGVHVSHSLIFMDFEIDYGSLSLLFYTIFTILLKTSHFDEFSAVRWYTLWRIARKMSKIKWIKRTIFGVSNVHIVWVKHQGDGEKGVRSDMF